LPAHANRWHQLEIPHGLYELDIESSSAFHPAIMVNHGPNANGENKPYGGNRE
jgi:hypothetical protein